MGGIAEDSHEGRSLERLRHHYEVERELAARLRQSTRDERMQLFGQLYGELFERVPDHPRLTRLETEESSRRSVEARMRLLRPLLEEGQTFLEIAAGDCRLCYEVAGRCERVIGVDISDQRAGAVDVPENFELVLFDGHECELPDGVADVVFSYQLLEHLHPDDVDPHFELVQRLLKPGGMYVFDTPHRLSGPHDVSRFFTDQLDCFHFQEWTYRGLSAKLLDDFGFSRVGYFRRGQLWTSLPGRGVVKLVESIVGRLPRRLRKIFAAKLFQSVGMVAWKAG